MITRVIHHMHNNIASAHATLFAADQRKLHFFFGSGFGKRIAPGDEPGVDGLLRAL